MEVKTESSAWGHKSSYTTCQISTVRFSCMDVPGLWILASKCSWKAGNYGITKCWNLAGDVILALECRFDYLTKSGPWHTKCQTLNAESINVFDILVNNYTHLKIIIHMSLFFIQWKYRIFFVLVLEWTIYATLISITMTYHMVGINFWFWPFCSWDNCIPRKAKHNVYDRLHPKLLFVYTTILCDPDCDIQCCFRKFLGAVSI